MFKCFTGADLGGGGIDGGNVALTSAVCTDRQAIRLGFGGVLNLSEIAKNYCKLSNMIGKKIEIYLSQMAKTYFSTIVGKIENTKCLFLILFTWRNLNPVWNFTSVKKTEMKSKPV